MEILVLADDPARGKTLRRGLEDARHEVVWIKDPGKGREAAHRQPWDAILLDLRTPGETGLTFLKSLRQEGVRSPVVVLAAGSAVDERVALLRAGADDCLARPYALVELLARLEALARRAGDRPTATLQVGDLTLDLTTRQALCGDVEILLTPTEFSILEMLMRYAGQVVTRKMVCEHLWEAHWEGTTNVLEVHINRLRNKLQRVGQDFLIQTVRGRGYVLRTP